MSAGGRKIRAACVGKAHGVVLSTRRGRSEGPGRPEIESQSKITGDERYPFIIEAEVAMLITDEGMRFQCVSVEGGLFCVEKGSRRTSLGKGRQELEIGMEGVREER